MSSVPAKKNRKVSCVHCRKLKRKCDGESPCSNCQKRNIVCEYSSTDRRSQRFSLVYIKSLETNAEIYENILNELVSLRGDKEALVAKLESLESTFPLTAPSRPLAQVSEEMASIQRSEESAESERAHLDDEENYYGPGSIYHFGEYTTPESSKESPSERIISSLETVHTNYNFIKSVVVNFFTHQWPSSNSYYLDKNAILTDLHKGNVFESPHLSEELLYAICANSESLSYEEADSYRLLALSKVYPAEVKSSIPLAQAYMLLAAHEFSLGKVTSGWQLSGSAMRMGYDLGFHHYGGPDATPQKNRLYFGFMYIDSYICMAVGRPYTIELKNMVVDRIPQEEDTDFYNLRDVVSLLELARPMLKATYEPVSFNKDPRINYLLKFNRSKMFNVKILKWKSDLPASSHWSLASLKAHDDLAFQNHNLKFLYWYVLLFVNKPFLHVPRQYSAAYIIEEMSKEVCLIVNSRLERMEVETRSSQLFPPDSFKFVRYEQTDPYHWATMDVCMITLLSHVIVTLIMDHPTHYLYLEKHLKTFTRYLNGVSARKYKCKSNAMERLLKRYFEWKSTRGDLTSKQSTSSMDTGVYEMKQLKETIDMPDESPYSTSTSTDHETPGSNYGVTSGSDSMSPSDRKLDDKTSTNQDPQISGRSSQRPPTIEEEPIFSQNTVYDAAMQQGQVGTFPQPSAPTMEQGKFDNSQVRPPYFVPPMPEYAQYPMAQQPQAYIPPQQVPPPPPHASSFHAPPPDTKPYNELPPNVQPNVIPPNAPSDHPMLYEPTPQSTHQNIHSGTQSTVSVPLSTMPTDPSLSSVPQITPNQYPQQYQQPFEHQPQGREEQAEPINAYDQGNVQSAPFYQAQMQQMQPSQSYTDFSGEQAPKDSDMVGQIIETLFRNTGEEFEAPIDQFNWEKLFDEKYAVMG
ncbi:hypothetical protein ACI3LY_003264 [Candidozyma auris]|uniref:Zn(2)-C6 fungal-type domain-containing protein n=2 Tax=Candidozyma auris TaxID=498019 RepID=A0AB36W940_CANAR|nr:hypothetical protein QG37_08263 [[Candida] auris]PIS52377.1 hypothetical protein B9J08_003992 [[Candida] auris]PIS54329.1 hypothetical protein CJI97_004031 [[Candida] auris]QWW21384.1 hypothetical protein CA7LBN_000130 [[Candida] auris]